MNEHDRAWALNKSRPVTEAMIRNLRKARSLPYAMGRVLPWRVGTYVVVGAGPSLSVTGPHLATLQSHGAVICTVNTALAAVNRYCVPDVVLAREVVDVSTHLAHPAELRVLDIGASGAAWDKAISMGPTAWFVPGQQQMFEVAAVAGVRPLYGGPAALTAMVALCEQWGAREIVLVGCDLALADDGSVYADGSAFGGMKASPSGDGVTYSGDEAKRAQHASGGIAPPPSAEATTLVPAWGTGEPTVRTVFGFADQLPWLETFASRYGKELAIIDATGAGARKAGWYEASIDEFVTYYTKRSNPVCARPIGVATPDGIDRVLADIARQADLVQCLSATLLDPDGAIVGVPGYLEGSDVVDTLAARDLILGQSSGASTLAKIRYAYGTAFPSAAMAAREALAEGLDS